MLLLCLISSPHDTQAEHKFGIKISHEFSEHQTSSLKLRFGKKEQTKLAVYNIHTVLQFVLIAQVFSLQYCTQLFPEMVRRACAQVKVAQEREAVKVGLCCVICAISTCFLQNALLIFCRFYTYQGILAQV